MSNFKDLFSRSGTRVAPVAAHSKARRLMRESRYENREARIDAIGSGIAAAVAGALLYYSLIPAAVVGFIISGAVGAVSLYHKYQAAVLKHKAQKLGPQKNTSPKKKYHVRVSHDRKPPAPR